MNSPKWEDVERIRRTVERYYIRNSTKDNINIPLYDLFVTETRKDWEQAGFDFTNEHDLFKLWGSLSITCSAVAHMLPECSNREQVAGALKVMGTYGNYTGLFLREMTRHFPNIPPVTPLPDEEAAHE